VLSTLSYRIYADKWRKATYGKDNGEGLFEKLQEKVGRYNSDTSAA